jgi:hypothetical protein
LIREVFDMPNTTYRRRKRRRNRNKNQQLPPQQVPPGSGESVKLNDDSSPGENLRFIDYDEPDLEAGTYNLTIEQQVESAGFIPSTTYPISRTFHVSGPCFQLQASDIQTVFPPDGSEGGHSLVLPHVVLSASTLPWVRSASTDERLPWLGLLLFAGDEIPEPQIVTLGELASQGAKFPVTDPEPGQILSDKVSVIDVEWSMLEQILPQEAELSFLAHVRQSETEDENGEPLIVDTSMVVGNRLPTAGQRNTVFLVSLENRYKSGEFDNQGAAPTDVVRLVMLKMWSFSATDSDQQFEVLLNQINLQPPTLRLAPIDNPGANTPAAAANQRLNSGFVPLPHQLRDSQNTVSWYHGPLLPGSNSSTLSLPVDAADALLYYNPETGMLDASYAAAWELGRLLALQDRQFSVALDNYKMLYRQQSIQAEQLEQMPHLPMRGLAKQCHQKRASLDLPEPVMGWLQDKRLLTGVPFNYLVADRDMLPAESLRFFQLDNTWVNCLLAGAFSIGTPNSIQPSLPEFDDDTVSGFLIRSAVVAGWPDLQVSAQGIPPGGQSGGQVLDLLRYVRLSENVLLCLFSGIVQSVQMNPRPEGLHFGVEILNAEYVRRLRSSDGETHIAAVNFRDNSSAEKVVVISGESGLTTNIEDELGVTVTSSTFAFQMVEATTQIAFDS